MPNVKFKAFLITGVDLAALGPKDRDAVAAVFLRIAEEAKWWERDGLRYSVVKCDHVIPTVVSGTFTQQHTLERHLYDESKRESSSELDSFEDRFFVIDFTSNLALLEWRQFRGKPPLTLPSMLDKFREVLASILTAITEAAVGLEPIDIATSREEFIQLFYENRVLYLEVDRFGIFSVPEAVELVNPNPHLEGALRDLLQHDREVRSIGRLTAEAEATPGSDLKRAAIARGAIHSSEPRTLRFQRPAGQVVVKRQNEQGIFEISVPADGLDSPQERAALVSELLDIVRSTDLGSPPAARDQQQTLFGEIDLE